jgi:hypothetical protein
MSCPVAHPALAPAPTRQRASVRQAPPRPSQSQPMPIRIKPLATQIESFHPQRLDAPRVSLAHGPSTGARTGAHPAQPFRAHGNREGVRANHSKRARLQTTVEVLAN